MGLSVFAALVWLAVSGTDRPEIVIADFEGVDYGKWTATGTAFGSGPAHGTLANQNPVTGFLGQGLVNTFFEGDKSVGTLTSPEFLIERKFINFLVGGGRHPHETCIRLLIAGKEVYTTTGADQEHLRWATWETSNLIGKSATIQIVDNNTAGWGHINVDQIVQSDHREAEAVRIYPVYGEPLRPQFHFTSKAGWLNDPNGLVWSNGVYHLFFQHNPSGTEWGNMTWGHATSRDLLHWAQHKNALLPDGLGTMFSGSAVVDHQNVLGLAKGGNHTLAAFYTAAGGTNEASKGKPFTQCLATSTDGGMTWVKYAGNPIIPNLLKENRDPKVVRHEPTRSWIMALYLDGNRFALLRSTDLVHWTEIQRFDMPDCSECPDFFEMPVEGSSGETRWVFTAANGRYLIGKFDGNRFDPEFTAPRQVEFGPNCYAVQTYSDLPSTDGRRIQVGWMSGASYPDMPFNQQMTIPCELRLIQTESGLRLTKLPVRETEKLRTWMESRPVTEVGFTPVSPISKTTDLMEIQCEIDPGTATEVRMTVSGQEIKYRPQSRELIALGRSANLGSTGGKLNVRVLADRTSLEIFVNGGRAVISGCFVPSTPAHQVRFSATGGRVRISELKVFGLRSVWR